MFRNRSVLRQEESGGVASAAGQASAPSAATPVSTPATPSPSQVAASPSSQNAEPSWLPDRLKRAEESAAREVLRALGVEKIDDAKAALAELKKRQDSEKTEAQRLADENAALRTRAARVDELEVAVRAQSDAALAALSSDEHRAAVKDLAGTDPAKIIKTIERMRAGGLLAAPPAPVAAPVVAPAPAVVTPPAPQAAPATTAPTTPAPSSSGSAVPRESHLATYEAMKRSNPMLAASYKLQNYAAIAAELKDRA